MLLQRQQTAASETFETLCGHFSLTAAEKNCGGWERKKKKREPLTTHNTNLMYVDENGRDGRGCVEGGGGV